MKRRALNAVLDALCPMHVKVNGQGIISHVGPTFRKLRPECDLIGKPLLHVLAVKRPRAIASIDDLRRFAGFKLHFEFRDPPHTGLKGVMMPLRNVAGEMVINLSFGISILDAVNDYDLSNGDFAPTDLAIEMLYLVEAKTAAMQASQRLNAKLQGAKIAAEEQAFTDTLTGLKNRRALNMVLRRRVESKVPFAVMQIDLDYFKEVNDTQGHAAGDFVLQNVAGIMVRETREMDTVARNGGDEFTIVLPELDAASMLKKVGNRIIAQLEKPMIFRDKPCAISASIGAVLVPGDDPRDGAALLADADVALYASKHAGRGQMTLYHPRLRETANTAGPPTDDGLRVAKK